MAKQTDSERKNHVEFENKLELNTQQTVTSENLKKQPIKKEIETFGGSKYYQSIVIEEVAKKVKDLFKDDLESIKSNTNSELKSNKEAAQISLNETKKDFFIIFGLFASFVTFISLNVQIFNKSNNIFELIGLCFISVSLVLIFAVTIHNTVTDKTSLKNHFTVTHFISIILLIIGIILLAYGGFKNEKSIENENKIENLQKELKILNSDIEILNEKCDYYKTQIVDLNNEIRHKTTDSVDQIKQKSR